MTYALLNLSYLQTFALVGIALLSLSIARTQTPSAEAVCGLEQSATTPKEFARLARYFAQQAALFHQSAVEESVVLEKEPIHALGASQHLRTADRARMLRDYYRRRAAEAHHKAQVYASRSRADAEAAG